MHFWDFESYAGNIAVIDDDGNSLCYSQLQEIGRTLKNMICSGSDRRNLVFNLCSNTLGSFVGYVSFLNNNVVSAMLSTQLDSTLLSVLIDEYTPSFIWAPEEHVDNPLLAGFKSIYTAYGYVLLQTHYNMPQTLHPDLALLLTTSGSTGSPKFVRQSYSSIRANTNSIVEYLHLDQAQRPITMLPMNYTYGISIINTHLDVGATILLTNKTIMQREFWDFFRLYGATSFGGVPYTYEMLKRLHFFEMDLPSLQTMTQAGGKLQPSLQMEFAQFALKTEREFVVMYGACEATARMSWLAPERSTEKLGSIGKAIPGGFFELLDSNGNTIEESDQIGELVYYGDNVTLGYASRSADLAKGDEWHGRYETGDMAKRDEEGFYFIAGRKKRFLKIFGNRINLDDCEQLLKEQFSSAQLACAGVDDNLYIFSTDEALLLDMKSYLSKKTGLNPIAFKTVALAELPLNESGKIMLGKLSEYYE